MSNPVAFRDTGHGQGKPMVGNSSKKSKMVPISSFKEPSMPNGAPVNEGLTSNAQMYGGKGQ
jgi:hypothetical protein